MDEMDLVSQLKDAAPLRPEAYERARATLRATMVESRPAPVVDLSRERVRRRRVGTWGKVGIGAGIGAVAAAVAVVLAATPAPRPAAPATASVSQAPAASSPLVSLAALITASSGSLPGNASLVIRTQAEGGIPAQVSYNLYVDGGAFYAGGDHSSLREAVARHQNISGGMTITEVKVALLAATGNLAAAREQMAIVSPGDAWLGLSGAAQKAAWQKGIAQSWPTLKAKGMKTPPAFPTGKALQSIIDNRVWNNSVDALSAGAGNPRVRAGVLRLLSTISAVAVAHSTTGGVPTLTITAGPEVFGGQGSQVLTINAKTGMPIKSVQPGYGKVPSSVDTYKVYRVTLAAIEAGKF